MLTAKLNKRTQITGYVGAAFFNLIVTHNSGEHDSVSPFCGLQTIIIKADSFIQKKTDVCPFCNFIDLRMKI